MNNNSDLLRRNINYTLQIFSQKNYIVDRLFKSKEVKKDIDQVMSDLLTWIWKYNAFDKGIYRFWGTVEKIIDSYFDSRCERCDCNIDDYMCEAEMHSILAEVQRGNKKLIKTLNHKDSFSTWCNQYNLPSTKQLGVIKKTENHQAIVSDPDGKEFLLSDLLLKYKALFCKPTLDCKGNGAFKIEIDSEKGGFIFNGKQQPSFPEITAPVIVERVVENHELLSLFHPASLNTLRLNTICDDNGKVDILWSCFRMGTKGRPVDNFFSGGVLIKVDTKTGYLAKQDTYGNIAHPDTNVRYQDKQIPYWKEVVELAIKAHNTAGNLMAVGWDIAVTKYGPILIEANVWFGIGPQQSLIGGLRPTFSRLLPIYIDRQSKK